MRVLVTGGAGFIGSAIVPKLIEHGHQVFVIDNLSFGNKDFLQIDDDQFFEIDIRNKEELRVSIEFIDPELVIHLAAVHFIPYCNSNPFESADINIRGTKNLLDCLKESNNVMKVFFASTAAVYPISHKAVSEVTETRPLDIYGLSKLAGEELMRSFHLETGVDTIVCRFFNAFGPNETNPHVIPEIENQLRRGYRVLKLGNVTPKRDFIHTHDMANAVISLINQNDIGFDIFNLGRGIEYSIIEVVEAFEKIIEEKIEIATDPDKVRKTERMHLLADVSKLKNYTGWEPEWSLERGIKDLVDNWNQ